MELPIYQVVFERWNSYHERHVIETGYVRADSEYSARREAYWIYGDLIDITKVGLLEECLDD